MNPSEAFQVLTALLEGAVEHILQAAAPQGTPTGFALVIFPFQGEEQLAHIVSNVGDPADLARELEAALQSVRADIATAVTMGNA